MNEIVELHTAWDARIRRLQRAHPARWHVRGWSDDEVRDALTLRVLEVARETLDDAAISRAVATRLNELRRTFRIRSQATDPHATPSYSSSPSDEERAIEREDDAARHAAGARAEARLAAPQRKWLGAMRVAAERGEFFASSDDLNLSAAARVLGRDRSAAKRAWDVLRARFARSR